MHFLDMPGAGDILGFGVPGVRWVGEVKEMETRVLWKGHPARESAMVTGGHGAPSGLGQA